MRATTWENIGEDVSSATNISEALTNAGLNYTVSKKPIYTSFEDKTILIPDRMATVVDGTEKVCGIVSPRYEVCQNIDAFDFVDNIEGVQFVKAGETGTGMIYVIGKLPDVTVLGDTFTPYVIFQNGHNGMYTLKTTICPLRIVCQNQFNMAFRESPNTISIQHSRQLTGKIAEAKKIITNTARYMQNFGNTAEELAMLKLGKDSDIKNIINAFFTISETDSDIQVRNTQAKRDELYQAYKADDNANFEGTVWGLVNGFSDYITHKEVRNTKSKDESKFMTVTFDPAMFTKFLTHVQAFAR